MADLYIGKFGIGCCVTCKIKRNYDSDKKLIMSLGGFKLCYDCGIEKFWGLKCPCNPIIIKERVKKSSEKTNWYEWHTLDKQGLDLFKQL